MNNRKEKHGEIKPFQRLWTAVFPPRWKTSGQRTYPHKEMHKDTDSLHMTLERHKYMHTQMQKIYYCLLNAHMWTKDVHIDKRDRTHVKKTQYMRTPTPTPTHTHTHTQCCLLIDVFASLAVGCLYCHNV